MPCTNEHEILTHIFQGSESQPEFADDRTGIIPIPDIFHELVRVSMVSPLYSMDMFDCLNHHTNVFQAIGFSHEIIVTYMAQLLEALKTLKDRNVVHRDIKPENICIQKNGNLVLTDFELAIIDEGGAGVRPKQDVLVGTTLYLSPETFQRLEYSYQSDLWAVAMIACELHSPILPWVLNERMHPNEVGCIIINTLPSRPPLMNDGLWSLISRILVPKEIRITVEEAMNDTLFGERFSFTKTTNEEKVKMGR